jgi:hypothetical protein
MTFRLAGSVDVGRAQKETTKSPVSTIPSPAIVTLLFAPNNKA